MRNVRIHNSNMNITGDLVNYIDGLLLSDGHISSRNIHTGRYMQPCKNYDWLLSISKQFLTYGVITNITNEHISKSSPNTHYDLSTRSYIEFIDFYNRWYKKDYNIDEYNTYYWHLDKKTGEYFIQKKAVPRDIKLTRNCVANWYLGDGSLHRDKRYNNSYTLNIATMGFSIDDIIFLSDLLSSVLDIDFKINKEGAVFISSISDITNFIDYIYEYKIPCYDYKFDVKGMRYKNI